MNSERQGRRSFLRKPQFPVVSAHFGAVAQLEFAEEELRGQEKARRLSHVAVLRKRPHRHDLVDEPVALDLDQPQP